ncbi:MAG TPA: 16S rRNA (cytosine(1402)-N(4))-methyltransferase RsmH [Solirubrobacteraceae bacterium]|nr:16S rRNA (cytosine(1402)-N(4))-methyltransferase RsmH [Solirubrobacteraceae bacterium]
MLAEMTGQAHIPVLAAELVAALDPQPGEVAVDCTFGAGGHAALVAERLGTDGLLIAIDRDPLAREHFERFSAEAPCATRFVHASFADGLQLLAGEGVEADMVYMDLGVSSMQIDTLERGFSYVYDAPLDMRMNPEQELTAADVVNTWEERQLGRAIKELGEERYFKQVSRAIVRARPLETTQELVEVITAAIPPASRFGGGHPAKRTFQAIRIVVNDELGQVERGLPLAWDLLRLNGRFAGISFHSLEDRPVKRFLADLAVGCVCPPQLPVCVCGGEPLAELLGRGGHVPTAEEIAANPRAKSARLRAARKLAYERPEDITSRTPSTGPDAPRRDR